MLNQELKNRKLPELKTREEMVDIMQHEVYGYLPKNNFEWSVSEPKNIEIRFGGIYRESEITFKMPLEAFRLGVPNPPVCMMQR